MNKSVTGIFSDRATAETATLALVAAGFRREQVAIVDADNIGRRAWIAVRVADTKRAVQLGALIGGVGGTIAGLVSGIGSSGVVLTAAIGGCLLAAGGALLGILVGRSTASQIQTELENEVDAGRVLVSVNTDDAHSALLGSILAHEGRASVVSSKAWFEAAILGGRTT
jgi:hypothetical protein